MRHCDTLGQWVAMHPVLLTDSEIRGSFQVFLDGQVEGNSRATKMSNMSLPLSGRWPGHSVFYKRCISVVYEHLVDILPRPKQVRVSHLLLDTRLTLHSDAVQLHKNANDRDCGLSRSWFLRRALFFPFNHYKFCARSSVLTTGY